MPSELPLLPFQTEAKAFALENKRVLINLPAGGGKSLIALSAVEKLNRVLVVCPAFLRLNWYKELEKWLPTNWHHVPIVYEQTEALETRNNPSTFTIVGYNYFESEANTRIIGRQSWDAVICDESQYVRKWSAKRCNNTIMNVCRGRENLIFLSATPLVKSAADLHPTFSVMQPGKWGSYFKFKNKYCLQKHSVFSPTGIEYYGVDPDNAKELKAKSKAFVFHRKESTVLSQLPPFQEITVPLDIGDCELLDETGLEAIERIIEGENESEFDEVKTERERVGLKKVPLILEWLENIPRKERVVIFAWHRKVVQAYVRGLKKLGFAPGVILGGMDDTKRMETISKFDAGRNNRIVCSISAAGLGLNLQSSSVGVCAEPPYTDADLYQIKKRIHRIGSKKHVKFYVFLAAGSIDGQVMEKALEKREASSAAGLRTES